MSIFPSGAVKGKSMASFEEMRFYLCCRKCSFHFPPVLARIIAVYAMQRFDDRIFGHGHWKYFWGAIPVSLPSYPSLLGRARRLESSGRNSPQPVEEMTSEACANFIQERGIEDHPEIPEELYICLNTPVRPGEKLAGFTCAVTYIPSFVRLENKIVALTTRTLSGELGPFPKRGYAAKLCDRNFTLKLTLTAEDSDAIQDPCYFVMELGLAPNTQGKKPSIAFALAEQRNWEAPRVRNFLATVFSRRVLTGEFPFGKEPWTNVYAQNRRRYLTLGGFGEAGLNIVSRGNEADADAGVVRSRKFQPLMQKVSQ